MRSEIQTFFEAYRDAFNALDGNAVAALYAEPAGIAQDGVYTHWADRQAVASNMRALCEMYRRRGFVQATFEPGASIDQGTDLAVVDVHWRVDWVAEPPWRFQTTYNLIRAAEGWRVLLCTAYSEAAWHQPEGTASPTSGSGSSQGTGAGHGGPPSHPRVGVGVIVRRDGRVLLGLRKGSHGAGTWALPGGHLEFGESVEACAARETEEETGLRLRRCTPGPFTNDVMEAEGKHYVTVFVIAEAEPGEAELREPGKCERWAWFDWSALPEPLFQPLQSLVNRGFVPDAAGGSSGGSFGAEAGGKVA